MIHIHTDGACRGNPGPGGWAWASGSDHYASGFEAHTTNQRMEVLAVIEALRDNPEGAIEIVSDSNYVVKCFHDLWYVGWLRRGWKNSKGEPVANRDLWELLFPLALESGRDVKFSKVKGHSGDRMNDYVDELATMAADAQQAQRS
jgi:ribonuclease HI